MKMSWEEEAEGVMAVGTEEAGSDQVAGFFPQGSLRVLLVEGDDSTRQIIAALLRKCNYKVASVSDGMEGWKLLKEKPHSIDLVLAEVEVPSVSGLDLLTTIMDDESCKNIPVIMMSSQDSMSIVYKCMLKGAADFLVKPIRRNELRNLWQHVWRRHSLTDSHADNQHGNLSKRKHEDMPGKEKNLTGYVHPTKKIKECSEKGSDAESSCTRSDVDAESTYKLIRQEPEQTKLRSFSLSKDSIGHNGEKKIHLNGSSQLHEGQAEGKTTMLGSEVKPSVGKCMSNELLVQEECSRTLAETNEDLKPTESVDNNNNVVNVTEEQNRYQDTPIKKAINLIGVMENQPDNGYGIREYDDVRSISDDQEKLYDKDVICRPSFMPLLEPSLGRYQDSSFKGERRQSSKLNHSGSSAFQQYNSRTAVPTTLIPMTSPADRDDYFCSSPRPIPDQGHGSSSSAMRWYGAAPNMNVEDVTPYGVGFPPQNGKAIKCSPLSVIPLPIPVGGTNFDRLSVGYGQLMVPMFYPQSSDSPLPNNLPSMWQEAIHKDSSHQSILKDVISFQSHQLDDQSHISPSHHADQLQEPEQVNSGNRSICNGTTNHLNKSGGGNFCNTDNETSSCNASGEVANEVKKLTDISRLSLREAALNKFRMKRKDRCFKKKVRYQSRKNLAEQRPRVKGQFVRHVQPRPPPTEV